MFKYLALLTASVLAAAPALAVNNSFETGDTSGWTGSSNSGAATSITSFTAVDGNFLGYAQGGNGTDVYATLAQTFVLSANQTLSGMFGFNSNDGGFYNDDGYVAVNGVRLIEASANTISGSTGWLNFSYVATTAGSYVLEIGARNVGDNCCGDPTAVLDGVTISAVPEPATWGLMLIGFALVGTAARRRTGALIA